MDGVSRNNGRWCTWSLGAIWEGWVWHMEAWDISSRKWWQRCSSWHFPSDLSGPNPLLSSVLSNQSLISHKAMYTAKEFTFSHLFIQFKQRKSLCICGRIFKCREILSTDDITVHHNFKHHFCIILFWIELKEMS